MATPITWRNVDGANLDGAQRGMFYAGHQFNAGFDKLGEVLKNREAMDVANWEAQKANNTAAFMQQMRQYQTPEALAAAQASGALDPSRYQAQIDQPLVGAAMDARKPILQQRIIADIQHKDATNAAADAPINDQIRMLRLVGKDAEADALMVTLNRQAPAAEFADAFKQKLVERGYAHNTEGRAADASNRAASTEARAITAQEDLLRNSASTRALQESQTAAAKQALEVSKTTAAAQAKAAETALRVARDAAILEGSPYANGVYNPATDAGPLMELMVKQGIGDSPEERTAIIRRISENASYKVKKVVNGKTISTTVPLPKALVIQSVLGAKDQGMNWWNEGWANTVEKNLKASLDATEIGVDANGVGELQNKVVNGHQLYLQLQKNNIEDPSAAGKAPKGKTPVGQIGFADTIAERQKKTLNPR
jgi:hypothetical protein